MVQESFLKLASQSWETEAQQRFLAESSPKALESKISAAACAIGAFSGEQVIGFLFMPIPTRLGMLFVHPSRLRKGIATKLWECARARLESKFTVVRTVELNATPYSVEFYRSVGFVPISAQFLRGGARAIRMACWLPARALAAELPR
ncbi:MAG TPA: GNAT family N-acetyltransferase [Steroidobacteraceae bacterium]